MIRFETLNQIADDTGAVYTTFFGEQGEQLLDLNAQDFGALLEDKEGSSEKAYEKAISGPIFKVKSFVLKALGYNFILGIHFE